MNRVMVFLAMGVLGYVFIQDSNLLAIGAGVAIFLYGMLSLENGFQAFAGGVLEKFLKKTTDKVYKSLGFGIITTTIMQSSSLVSILAISFLSAGLIGLSAGIGIIFGANIGTTSGAWLVAGLGLKVNISTYAMPMLVFGVMLIFRKKNKTLQGLGYVLAGLGFLFLGIHYMKEGFEAFKSSFDLSKYAIGGFKGLFIYAGIGVVATVVMQSSHATLVLIITALAAGQITYENALALAVGSNVGTTITAIIGSLGANIDGKRLAVAHLIFNLITALITILLIKQFIIIVDKSADFLGIASEDYTLKLALFHTFFNLLGVALIAPFINTLTQMLNKYIKSKPKNIKTYDDVLYLNESALSFVDTAKEALYKETKHFYTIAQNYISYAISIDPLDIGSSISSSDIIKIRHKPIIKDLSMLYMKQIKPIYSKIINFAIRAQVDVDETSMLSFTNIRRANLLLAETVKDAHQLQANMIQYIHHENQYIKKEYNNIRKNIIKELRYMHMFLSTNEDDLLLILMDKIIVSVKKFDVLLSKNLEELIRNNKINSSMATSLMNDTAYASNIALNLSNIAKLIYESKSKEHAHAMDTMLLSEHEIKTLAKQ